jgi:hypothetical protein
MTTIMVKKRIHKFLFFKTVIRIADLWLVYVVWQIMKTRDRSLAKYYQCAGCWRISDWVLVELPGLTVWQLPNQVLVDP